MAVGSGAEAVVGDGVVEFAQACGSVAADAAAGFVAGVDEVFEVFGGFVAGASDVQDGAVERVGEDGDPLGGGAGEFDGLAEGMGLGLPANRGQLVRRLVPAEVCW